MIPIFAQAEHDTANAILTMFGGLLGVAIIVGICIFLICLIVAPLAIWSHTSATCDELRKLNKNFDSFYTTYLLRQKPPEKPSVDDLIL